MTQLSVTAKVTMTVEVTATGNWGENCSIGQVRDQAKEQAAGMLRRVIGNAGEASRFRITEYQKVDVIEVQQ